jgi:hypothetical protein
MNLAQTDPYYIPQASQEGRLALVRTVGPFSGGTHVKFVRADDEFKSIVVSGTVIRQSGNVRSELTIEVFVTREDLVIRRDRSRSVGTADAEE